MRAPRLVVFVEGTDDTRLVQRICSEICADLCEYDFVQVMPYSHRPPRWVRNFIRALKAQGAEYLYLRDLDERPCVTSRKEDVLASLGEPAVDIERIVIVKREIETWYLAGAPDDIEEKLRKSAPENTETLSKEQFERLIPRRVERIPFLVEIAVDLLT